MSKHIWECKKLTESKRIEIRKLIDLAREKRFTLAFCSSDSDLNRDKASKSFAIYVSERQRQDSSRMIAKTKMLWRIRESTLLKYSQYIPWLDKVLDGEGENK